MSIESAKRAVGRLAVDDYVSSGMKVGIGSGSTIEYSIERLGEKLKEGSLKDIVAVCTSFQSTLSCRRHKVPVTTLDDPRVDGVLDVAIDGADEFDADLNLIKGGGGAHTQEKIVDGAAKTFVVIVDDKKRSTKLGEKWAVPVEIIPIALSTVMKRLESLGAKPELRMAVKKMGPVITDNGNFIVDAKFGIINEPAKLEATLNNIPGVVENGIFAGMATVVYLGKIDGSTERISRN
nr:ribose-5-phosphate isomerase RpiA [Candidatus Sigynarchaeota archaeon]